MRKKQYRLKYANVFYFEFAKNISVAKKYIWTSNRKFIAISVKPKISKPVVDEFGIQKNTHTITFHSPRKP